MGLSNLPLDYEVTRRIAFVMASVASRFGLPLQARPEILLQSAMEQPEAITPQEYKLIYRISSAAQ
jgi:hypothetical protein